MARGCALLEILRRHAPDAGELLRKRSSAPHRRPYAVRSYRRDAAVSGGGGGFAVVRRGPDRAGGALPRSAWIAAGLLEGTDALMPADGEADGFRFPFRRGRALRGSAMTRPAGDGILAGVCQDRPRLMAAPAAVARMRSVLHDNFVAARWLDKIVESADGLLPAPPSVGPATYLGVKGGANDAARHVHYDLGSFVLDCGGLRGGGDLCSDDSQPPRYFYCPMRL